MTRAEKKLEREYKSFVASPLDYIKVSFEKGTSLEWHFLFLGQIGTPFEGGEYHGTLVFPENYPFSPPSTRLITPNGRFQTDERVCFSISDFHPENWKPAYTMSSFLQGVYCFMMTETTDTVGSLEMNVDEIRELAGKSREFNLKDGTAELSQNETKAALTGNSDTDPIPSPINNLDISSSPPDVLSKQAKPNNTTVTVGNLGMDTNSEMGLASKSRESTENVAALIYFFQSQFENVNSPSSENTKLTTRFKSKPSHEITQPSKSTESADQLILPHPVIGKVISSTVSSDSTSDPSQRSGSNGVNNSEEKQEDNVTSSSEPPEDSKHLPTDTVRILDMDEEEIKKLARMSKEFNEHDEACNKMFKEEIDETIQSSLNNFSANVKSEHICTSANGTHDNYNIITTLSSQSTANLNSHWLNRAKKRLLSEFKEISDNPSDNILIEFTEDKFLEWHFLFKGLKETLFEGGEYHGMLEFPENYPFYPPSVQFFTPNGRFKTNERVRFILSDFCPKCSNHSYTVSAVLQVAYAFMMSETTGTVGSLILNENEIRNLARMSKEFNRDNDTFNELFIDKVDEDIEYPLDNSDDLIRKKNIERPSDLIPIAVPDTTRLTQSISTHKTNERPPSHLAKVDKEEHAIGQNSSFTANTSRNSFNCPSNSDEGKESHISKLLDRTLPEESKSTHGHNSATHVSQYPERPENVSVRSPDYVINNARDSYNRDTSDIPKPNKEVSSEKSNDSLSQNTTSNRSMDSSKKSTTFKFSASPPKGSENAQMPKTDRTPDSLPHAQTGITSVTPDLSKESSLKKFQPNLSYNTDTYSANPPKRLENVEIPKTGHPPNSLPHAQTGITSVTPDSSKESSLKKFQPNLSYNTDTYSANPPKRPENVEIPKTGHPPNSLPHAQTRTTSVAPDSSKEFTFRKSQPNLSYNTDTYSANPPKRPENVEIPKTGRTPNSLPHAQTGTTSVAPDSSKEFSFRKSQPNLSYNAGTYSANPPKRSENVQMPKTGRNHSPTDRGNGYPLQFLNDLSCPADVVTVPFSDKPTDDVSFNTTKLQMSMRSAFNPSTAHQLSSVVDTSSSYSHTLSSDILNKRTTPGDKRSTHLYGRSESILVPKADHTHLYLTYNQAGVPSVVPDSMKEFSSKIYQSDLHNTTNKWSADLSKESEKVSVERSDHAPNSLTDRENGYLSQFLNDSTCHPDVVSNPFSDLNSDSFLPLPQNSNARIGRDFSGFRGIDSVNSNIPHSDYSPQPLPPQELPEVSHGEYLAMNSNITSSDNINHTVSSKTAKLQKSPLYAPITSATHRTSSNTHINQSHSLNSPINAILCQSTNGSNSIKRSLPYIPTSSVTNELRVSQKQTINGSMVGTPFDSFNSSIAHQTSPILHSSPSLTSARDGLSQKTSGNKSKISSSLHSLTSSTEGLVLQTTEGYTRPMKKTSSHPHAYSSTNMSFQDACSNNSVSKYVSHIADSQTTDIISRPLNSSTNDRLYHSTSDGLSMKNSSPHVPITSNVYRHVQKKSGNEKRKPPFYPPTSLSTNKHLHNSSDESIERRLLHPPSSPINNIRQNVNCNRTIHKSMLDFSKSPILYQTYLSTYSNSHHHRPNSPAKDILCQDTSDHYSIERSPHELFRKTSNNRSIVRPLPDSSNSSTAAHRESNINQSHSLTSAKSNLFRSGSISMNTFPSHHSTSSASKMLAGSTNGIKSAKIPPLYHPLSSATDKLPSNVSSNKSIVTPPLDSPVPSTKGKLAKNTTRNRSISKSLNDLPTSSARNRKIENSKQNLSSSHSDISLCKRQQNYRTTRPILPHDTLYSLSTINCKTPNYTDSIKGYGIPSSPTSRSLNDKLKLQPNTSFSPKLTKSKDLDFNCGRKNALSGNIDFNLCLKKTTKISKSLETAKELQMYGSSVLSRNKYTNQSIANKDTVTNAALKGSLGRSNERLAKSEIDKKILKVKIDTDALLKSNESKIESRKCMGIGNKLSSE